MLDLAQRWFVRVCLSLARSLSIGSVAKQRFWFRFELTFLLLCYGVCCCCAVVVLFRDAVQGDALPVGPEARPETASELPHRLQRPCLVGVRARPAPPVQSTVFC